MQGQPEALRQVKALGLEQNVQLLPYVSQPELWNLYRQSQVYVSLSSHDGTPNTLLEAMAFGCLPVCGDIESIREWIADKQNGLLVDPLDARAAAQALITVCRDQDLRKKAGKQNQRTFAQGQMCGSTDIDHVLLPAIIQEDLMAELISAGIL